MGCFNSKAVKTKDGSPGNVPQTLGTDDRARTTAKAGKGAKVSKETQDKKTPHEASTAAKARTEASASAAAAGPSPAGAGSVPSSAPKAGTAPKEAPPSVASAGRTWKRFENVNLNADGIEDVESVPCKDEQETRAVKAFVEANSLAGFSVIDGKAVVKRHVKNQDILESALTPADREVNTLWIYSASETPQQAPNAGKAAAEAGDAGQAPRRGSKSSRGSQQSKASGSSSGSGGEWRSRSTSPERFGHMRRYCVVYENVDASALREQLMTAAVSAGLDVSPQSSVHTSQDEPMVMLASETKGILRNGVAKESALLPESPDQAVKKKASFVQAVATDPATDDEGADAQRPKVRPQLTTATVCSQVDRVAHVQDLRSMIQGMMDDNVEAKENAKALVDSHKAPSQSGATAENSRPPSPSGVAGPTAGKAPAAVAAAARRFRQQKGKSSGDWDSTLADLLSTDARHRTRAEKAFLQKKKQIVPVIDKE